MGGSDAGARRLARRGARSVAAVDALGTRIGTWLAGRRADPVFHRFATHLDVLETVLTRMADRLRTELAGLPGDVGAGYDRCRAIDRGIGTLRRLFEWYATRYDQRADEAYRAVLGAADELARSCWAAGFVALRRTPPTGPLCFVDNRADAVARGRCEVGELVRVADDPVADLLDRLPVPLIALPEPAVREGWWLVLAAHETGHLVLLDLGLVPQVKAAVRDAVPAELVEGWTQWHVEVFADVYSALMVGGAAGWAVDELQFGPGPHLLLARGGHPAPVVRAALIDETVRALGGAPGDPRSVLDEPTAADLAVVPDVVKALLDIPLGQGRLRDLAATDVVRAGTRLREWSRQLGRPEPAFGALDTRDAPRVLAAAAVHRYRVLTGEDRDESLPALHTTLLDALAGSGAPGVLAPRAAADLDALADDMADLLVERTVAGASS